MTEPDAFCEAILASYLAFHRRDGRRNELFKASQ